jgi:TRAP-type C4-dicarboxylate transport system permease small subunit
MLNSLEKFAISLSKWLNWVAGAGLVVMLGLVVADIIGIKLFSWPIPGGIEIIAFSGVVVTGFAIAFTQVLREHIQVEFVVMRLPQRAQPVIAAFVTLLGLALFVLLGWQSVEYGLSLAAKGTVSMTQGIPFYPFVHAIAFCCIPICLLLLVEFFRSVMKAVKR